MKADGKLTVFQCWDNPQIKRKKGEKKRKKGERVEKKEKGEGRERKLELENFIYKDCMF